MFILLTNKFNTENITDTDSMIHQEVIVDIH